MTQQDKDRLNEFIKEYREIGFNVDLMQQSIQGLAEKRDRMLTRLEQLKEEERVFFKEISARYGDSQVTPNQLMQYIEE
jgi:DNA-binding transcriptional MerR regulator